MEFSRLLTALGPKTDRRPSRENGTEEDGLTSSSESLNDVFDILSSSRRRHVLRRVIEHDGSSTISDLAEHVASIENGKPVSALTSQERKRVYVSLYQAHLPRMAETDVVELDSRGTVTLGSNAEDVYDYLLRSPEPERKSETPYALHTVGSSVALVVGFLWLESLLPLLFALSLFGYALLVGWQFASAEAV